MHARAAQHWQRYIRRQNTTPKYRPCCKHMLLNGCFYVLSEELLVFRIEIGEQMMSSENDIPVNIIQLVMQITPEQRQLLFYVQAFVHYK